MPNPLIKLVINKLISQGVMGIIDIITRQEKVVEILKKQIGNNPDSFEWLYILTYVTYCKNQPEAVWKLFREETIEDAYYTAFLNNNDSLLITEVRKEVESSSWGDEIKEQKISYEKTINEFWLLLKKMSRNSLNVSDQVLSDQVKELDNRVREMQGAMNQIPQKEDNQFFQQIKQWFQTLNYGLETYEKYNDNYFECIINIPKKRQGYERIFIRGVEGEASLIDVHEVTKAAKDHNTDEGWIVARLRIAPAAKHNLKDNNKIYCYTFDELIDQDANFTKYITWLETYVEKRKIDTFYVPLACRKEIIDPDTQQKLGVSIYNEEEGWIEGYIERWLDDPVKEHISVLGEFGTGKTWFVFHYAWKMLQKYKEAKKKGIQRPRLPLVIPLRDYARAAKVESLLSEFCFRKHEIGLPGYSAFEELNRMGKLLLIFDGFDEMAARVDRQQMIDNFWELTKVVVSNSKVILR